MRSKQNSTASLFSPDWHITSSPRDTQRLAARLVRELPAHAVLALHGDLGSGKTCFVQGIAQELRIDRMVTSPTFTIVNEYHTGTRALFHVDLYRLAPGKDLDMLGLDECMDEPGITVIEWAERAAGCLPPHAIHIRFEVLPGEDRRRIRIARG